MKNLFTTVFAVAAFAVVAVAGQAQLGSVDTNSSNSLTFAGSSNSNSELTFASTTTAPNSLSAAIEASERQAVLQNVASDKTTTADNSSASTIDLILGSGVAGAIIIMRRKRASN